MPIDVNSTAALLGAFGVMDRTKPVLLNLFFPYEQRFETEEVYFDRVQRARRLAPFVVPTIEGKPRRSRGYNTLSFKPPYLKPKHFVEPLKAVKRRAGEPLLGTMSPAQRRDLAVIDCMQMEDDEITRREEWMATSLLLNGTMVCQSDDHPPLTIDLGRNSSHTSALTGALRWGQSGVDPLQNLRSWAATVQNDSGFHPGVVVMDPLAADTFLNGPGVLRVMQSFRQTEGNIDLAGAVTGGLGHEAKVLGSIGEFVIIQYQQTYLDDSGTAQKFMPPNTIIMGDPVGAQGVRTYGAILDDEALVPLPRFPKSWVNKDPSVRVLMTQSAPLPLMGWPDATFSVTVA